jgi:hypothetical protein
MVGGGGGRPSDCGSRRGRNRWRTPQGRVTARSARTPGHRTSPQPPGWPHPDTVAGCGGYHGGQAGHGTAAHGGRPRACVRPCPACTPEAARLWPAGGRRPDTRPGPQIGADTGMAIDTSLASYAGHRPSGGWWFRKQRTVNPPMVPARYNFLYASSRPARRPPSGPAATGAPASPSAPGDDGRQAQSTCSDRPIRSLIAEDPERLKPSATRRDQSQCWVHVKPVGHAQNSLPPCPSDESSNSSAYQPEKVEQDAGSTLPTQLANYHKLRNSEHNDDWSPWEPQR